MKEYLREWETFVCEYVRTGSTDAMPENWSSSEVFPCVNMATIGDAGTGKTTAMREYHATQPGITITPPINKSSNSYLMELERATQPKAWTHMASSNTLYKMLGINYASKVIQEMLKRVDNDTDLQKSFEKVLNETSVCGDAQGTCKLMRQHTRVVLKYVHPIVVDMVERRLNDFRNGGYRYRLYTASKEHSCYTPSSLPTSDVRFSIVGDCECLQRF